MSSDWHNRSGGNKGDGDRPHRGPSEGRDSFPRGPRSDTPGGFPRRGPGENRDSFPRGPRSDGPGNFTRRGPGENRDDASRGPRSDGPGGFPRRGPSEGRDSFPRGPRSDGPGNFTRRGPGENRDDASRGPRSDGPGGFPRRGPGENRDSFPRGPRSDTPGGFPRRSPGEGRDSFPRGPRSDGPGGFPRRGPDEGRGSDRAREGFREEGRRPRGNEERPEGWRPFTAPSRPGDEQRQLGPRSWAFAERDEWSRQEQAPDTGHGSFGRGPRDGSEGRGGFRQENDRPYDGRREEQGRGRDDRPRAPFAGDRAGFDRGDRRPPFAERPGRAPFERRDRPAFDARRERPAFEQPRFEDGQDRPLFQEGRPLGTVTRQGRSPVSEFERVQADVYGRWPVLEALRAGNITRIYLAAGVNDTADHLREVIALAEEQKIPLARVDRLALDRAAEGANHQGIAATARPFAYVALEEIVERAGRGTELPLLVLFDGVQDPQNLGSVLRTADAAGVQGAVLPQHHQAGITPAVIRASAGAAEHLPVAQVTNLRQSIDTLKEAGYWIVGLDMDGGTDYDNVDVERPIALIVGGEGRGLGRLVTDQCDYLVRLPMRGHVSSLNVSVATGIVLYEIQRRRPETVRHEDALQAPTSGSSDEADTETGSDDAILESGGTAHNSAIGANVEGVEDPGDIEGTQDYDAFADVLEAAALGLASDSTDPEDSAQSDDNDFESADDGEDTEDEDAEDEDEDDTSEDDEDIENEEGQDAPAGEEAGR